VRYGSARTSDSTTRLYDLSTQESSLRKLAQLTRENTVKPLVRNTALRIRAACAGRDDMCELKAIFDTIKHGNPDIAPFVNGFAYVADPRFADYFTAPEDSIRNCMRGACGGDCDDHTALVAALCAGIGFKVGLRAWGRDSRGFSHVYPVVAFPKRPPCDRVLGMDTTVEESKVGWEPPKGNIITAWLD
jgi:hypothetical protein